MIRWLHLLSFILLAGAFASLRMIVLPALDKMAPEARALCTGAVMSRTRRVLGVSLGLWVLTGLWLLRDLTVAWDWREIAGGIAGLGLFASARLLGLSPARRLALRTQPRRRLLLDTGLLCAATLLLAVYFR